VVLAEGLAWQTARATRFTATELATL